MIVLLIIQLLFIPLFLYMLDAIVRDNKEYVNSLIEAVETQAPEIPKEDPVLTIVEDAQS